MNLQFLNNIAPAKTRVSFMHAVTGELIGKQKMAPGQLPNSFDKPTVIEWQGIQWRVLKAEPMHAREYTLDNKLVLHVQENSVIDIPKMGYDLATVCKELPATTTQPLYDDFCLDISKDQWKQLEFLPVSLLPLIKENMLKIESILFPGNGTNTLMGYKDRYLREKLAWDTKAISVEDFCQLLPISQKGSVRFIDGDFIQNGFALHSGNYIYYGTLSHECIEELCLQSFDCVDEEFFQLASEYDLVLADWCNGKIIMT